MKRICLCTFFLLTIAWSSALAADVRLVWQVVQPFRLLRFESDQKIHEWALADLMADNSITNKQEHLVSELEKRLNSPSWWNKKPPGSAQTYAELLKALRAKDPNRMVVPFEPRLGWAAMLRDRPGNSPIEGTCWNARAKSYDRCSSDIGQINGRDDYVFPKRHLVEIRIEEKIGSDWRAYPGPCTLALAAQPNAGFGLITEKIGRGAEKQALTAPDCGTPVFLRVQNGETYTVSVTAGDIAQPVSEPISVRDLLIVGIGDSFASGEGNPDLPAWLDPVNARSPYVKISDNTNTAVEPNVRIPTRKLGPSGRHIATETQARWLDPQCHRSMYSPQARAALALALHGQRHHAVTFVSYACSGAEVTDGIFWPQDHRECGPAGASGLRHHQPQLSGIVDSLTGGRFTHKDFSDPVPNTDRFAKDIKNAATEGWVTYRNRMHYCRTWPGGREFRPKPWLKSGIFRRPIDLLMVSIGGNDIGFAPLVSKVVVNAGLLDVPIPGVTELAVLAYQQAANAIGEKEAKRRIDNDLVPRFALLGKAVRSKLEIDKTSADIKPQDRVILTAYPRLANATKASYCGGGNRGLNVSKLLGVKAKADVEPGDVTPEIADAITVRLNAKLANIAASNGWNFVNGHVDLFRDHGFCSSASTSADPLTPTAELLDMPQKSATGWRNVSAVPYNPVTNFYPYANRKRWVRTFNDAYMLSFYFKKEITEELAGGNTDRIYSASRALGGPIHPTAQGYANMADGLYNTGVKVLFKDGTAR